jgi:hypothetical protein
MALRRTLKYLATRTSGRIESNLEADCPVVAHVTSQHKGL